VVPDLEACGVFVEGWVFGDDFVCYFCAVLFCQFYFLDPGLGVSLTHSRSQEH
jgi:hypothetical protein